MKRDPRTIVLTLGRCLKLWCPACGRATVFEKPFNLKTRCTACGVIFKREEGFFVGAIMANVMATEVVILVVYFLCLLITNLDEQKMLTVLFVVGVTRVSWLATEDQTYQIDFLAVEDCLPLLLCY